MWVILLLRWICEERSNGGKVRCKGKKVGRKGVETKKKPSVEMEVHVKKVIPQPPTE